MNSAGDTGSKVIHINITKTDKKWVEAGVCSDCKKRTRFLVFFQEWYGIDATCLRCGRQFNEEGWNPLAFYRYARRDNILAAKKRWRRSK